MKNLPGERNGEATYRQTSSEATIFGEIDSADLENGIVIRRGTYGDHLSLFHYNRVILTGLGVSNQHPYLPAFTCYTESLCTYV